MRVSRGAVLILLAAGVSLAGCSGKKEPQLMNIRSTTNTPDEFAILPNKPLTMPEDMAALPAPTPGGTNRVDPTPEADAVAALGGKPSRLAQTGVPGSEAALVSQASRFGVAAGIRQTLAAEDLEFRRDNNGRILERLLNVTVYYKAYRKQSLDQYAELERWRRAGARTVGAPPSRE